MTTKERLKKFAAKKGFGQNSFEKHVGVAIGYLSSKSVTITSDTIEKVYSKFPSLSLDWLINGSGEMEKNNDSCIIKTKPRIPFAASAGFLTSSINGITIDECEKIPIINAFPSYDFTIAVKGESMYPEIKSGDEVACKRIDENRFIQWGRIHVLDTTQGVVIKKIYDENKGIRCVSTNSDYKDFVIPKEDIYSISLVVGLLRL